MGVHAGSASASRSCGLATSQFSKAGSNVRSVISAITIAVAVNNPKYTLGRKSENPNNANPIDIMVVVNRIASPVWPKASSQAFFAGC